MDRSDYYLKNKESIKQKTKDYRKLNRDEILVKEAKYRETHKEIIAARKKVWYERNKQRVNEKAAVYSKERRKIDPNFKLSLNLRRRLNKALYNKSDTIGSAVKDLGCTVSELKAYLESKFQAGMTWNNYGPKGWHLDHIKPLASFDLTDRKQFLEANHYTNLQPLWAVDNLKKNGKVG